MWLLCSVNQISGATTTLATPHHNHIELISRDLVLYVKEYYIIAWKQTIVFGYFWPLLIVGPKFVCLSH